MTDRSPMEVAIEIRLLETPAEMETIERLSLDVWPGSEMDVIPAHLLLTIAKNGGIVLGAFEKDRMIAYAFGFLGLHSLESNQEIKHCSHQLGVHPDYQSSGVGFKLKRAQWQLVRQQGLDLITWTYDPLLSLNANLNFAKLGAIANTYLRELYGQMRDGLNIGLPSDRIQMEWWVNSKRVIRRLSSQPRPRLDMAHFLAAGVPQINHTSLDSNHWPVPETELLPINDEASEPHPVVLLEIPADFPQLKSADMQLASNWREHTRMAFEMMFSTGYYITDFVFLPGKHPRSFYVLTYGDTTLGDET
ncbi:MAG: GNAT family N-acetyltransferase [Anaerolineae bacterium]|nr:GNAT family N-acetyltransferase [Anaerolineae bacterium]